VRFAPALGFAVLLAGFWLTGGYFGITGRLGPQPGALVASFVLLLAPYWFFGFGLADTVRRRLTKPIQRIGAVALFIIPYLVFAIPRGDFRGWFCLALLGTMVAMVALLELAHAAWADYVALGAIALIIERHVFDSAWPIAGLSGLAKLLFVDVVLYGYLVVRREQGFHISFDFRAKVSDFAVGLREFGFYAPVALTLGLALGFLHPHGGAGSAGHIGAQFAASWLFTLFFVALPEELFFRGILLQLLEKSLGNRASLLVTSVLFGLAHFNKRAVFNWRYVILAAIAGFFYGRAYLAHRRVLTAGVTHTTVDTVWSIWLK
jgi:membrane protease YdiL (CAAX protease family)